MREISKTLEKNSWKKKEAEEPKFRQEIRKLKINKGSVRVLKARRVQGCPERDQQAVAS